MLPVQGKKLRALQARKRPRRASYKSLEGFNLLVLLYIYIQNQTCFLKKKGCHNTHIELIPSWLPPPNYNGIVNNSFFGIIEFLEPSSESTMGYDEL